MDKKNVADIYKLTPLQEGMLFHALSSPGSDVYIEQFARMVPRGRAEDWSTAFNQVCAAHPILRSGFHWEGLEKPVQVVLHSAPLTMGEFDWSGMDGEEQQRKLNAFLEEERRIPFDLRKPPLMRLYVIHVSEGQSWFIWTYHHILLDGWSAFLVLDEFFSAYEALLTGQEYRRRPAPLFKDYVRWLQSQDTAAAEAFWRRYLQGFAAPTPLGLVESSGQGDGPDYAILRRRLSGGVPDRLRGFVRDRRLTLNTLLQGAWGYLLSILSGEDDVVFGSTTSGRPTDIDGADGMIGLFINTLPTRIRVDPGMPVAAWLQHVQKSQLELRAFEHSSLVQVQGWSAVPRTLRLFDSMMAVESFPNSKHVDLQSVAVAQKTNYPLTLVVEPGRDINVKAMFDPRRYDPAQIDRLLARLEAVLTGFVDQAEAPLGTISIMDEEDRAELARWNATAAPYPKDTPLTRIFEEMVARHGDRTAVVAGGERVDYRGLDQQANRLARYLTVRGVRPGDQVAIMLQPSVDMIAAIVAIVKLGCAYAPLDPQAPAARNSGMLADLKCRHLVTHRGLGDGLTVAGLDLVDLDRDGPGFAMLPADRPEVAVDTRKLIYVIHTSGSTGKPKAAGVFHHSFVNLMTWWVREFTLTPDDRNLLVNKVTFDLSQKNIWGALMTGGALHLNTEPYFEPAAVRRMIRADQITWMNCTSSMAYALIEAEGDGWSDMSSLRFLMQGGEPLDKARIADFLLSGDFRGELVNTYGPTECTDLCAVHRFTTDEFRDLDRPVTVGRALPNIHLYILDRFNNPLPRGVGGEVVIGGVSIGSGYLNNAGMSADKFIPDTIDGTPGDRLYRTGDRGYFQADGSVVVRGRVDFQVKIRGYRVELGEIDTTLRLNPLVADSITVLRPGDAQQLVSYIVPSDEGAALDRVDRRGLRQRLKDGLAERLPDYMVPAVFVTLAAIPLNDNGKVDRAALPAPDGGDEIGTERILEARTPVEAELQAIWQKVLGLPSVGITDNFFELGGHSLSITQVYSRIPKAFGVQLPLSALFEHPTIQRQAALIQERQGSGAAALPPLVRAARPDRLPLSFAQSRLWFLHRYAPDSLAYNVPNAIRFDAPVSLPAMEEALTLLTERHESLRTRFPDVDGTPAQVILPPEPVVLRTDDLTGQPREEQLARLGEIATGEAQWRFDLESGPLARFRMVLHADGAVLFVTMHHIITDGWSMDLFTRDLRLAYAARIEGRSPEWAPLPIQYADYTLWQQTIITGTAVTRQIDYWRSRLAGAASTIALPYDFPRPARRSNAGGVVRRPLPPELGARLKALADANGATLFMVMLAGFQALLYRMSGQEDLSVGTPIANRHLQETEPVIGFFVNTLVMRAHPRGEMTFRDLLAQTRQAAHEGYDHQDVPFELLVDTLNPPRSATLLPFFQVMFALQRAYEDSSLIDDGQWISRFDLQLVIYEEGLVGAWEYDSSLFTERTVLRFADHLENLLASAAENPDTPLSRLELAGGGTPSSETGIWNHTTVPYPADAFIHTLFEQMARERPDAVTLWCGDRKVTYAELNREANRLAHRLIRAGIREGSSVGLGLGRSVPLIVATLAVLKAGGIYVPLDPAYPEDRLRYMAEDSGVPLILADTGSAAAMAALGRPVWTLDGMEPAADDVLDNPSVTGRLSSAERIAYIIYTSGTTGRPKGVEIPHRGAVRLVRGQPCFRFGPDTVMLHLAATAFDASTLEIWGALLNGGQLVIHPGTIVDTHGLSGFLRAHDVNTMFLTTGLFGQWMHEAADLPDSLQLVMAGGEVVPPQAVQRLYALSPTVRFVNAYGPTENSAFSTIYEVPRSFDFPRALPIGRPVANSTAYVLDGEMRPAPVGTVGELYVGGHGVALGYRNRPDLTAEKFVSDPFDRSPDARLYRTGDLVRRRPDGEIDFLGRADQQIKLRGFRIELAEIQTVLDQQPGVQQAIIGVHESPTLGKELVAWYLLGPDADVSPGSLRQALRSKLPDYMVPTHLVRVDSFPLTGNGKVDRLRLPPPDPDRQDPDAARLAPRNDTEAKIFEIWAEVLNRRSFGVDQSFFDLGGNSLAAIRLVALVRSRLGRSITVPDFFAAPTVADLARIVDAGGSMKAELDTLGRKADPTLARIEIPHPLPAPASTVDAVLLTGGTGYVGAYLVAEALSRWPQAALYLQVRAGSREDGLARIRRNLQSYGLWRDDLAARLHIVLGDISQPRLGLDGQEYEALSRRIAVIIHNASHLNHVQPFEMLRDANLGSTQQLLAFAMQGQAKSFALVSTTGVLRSDGSGRAVDEGYDLLTRPPPLAEGYNASKWAAELAALQARDAGLPVQIIRLGRIGPDSVSGIARMDDFPALLLRTCLRLNAVPGYPLIEQVVPVDHAARSIVALASDHRRSGTFHIVGKERVDWSDLIARHGDLGDMGMRKLDVRVWAQQVKDASVEEPMPFAPYLFWWDTDATAPEEKRLKILEEQTVRELGRLGVKSPKIGVGIWKNYLTSIFAAEGRDFIARRRFLSF